MASYSVECSPSLIRAARNIDTSPPNYEYLRVIGSDNFSFQEKTWVKFSIDSLLSYRKKKVSSAYFKYYDISIWGTNGTPNYSGGSIAWLQSTFDSSVLWSNSPVSRVWFFFYALSQGTFTQPLTPYQLGNIGYDGIAAPRSFYDQLSVGFELANSVNSEDWKKVNYQSGTSPYITALFNFEDWSPTLTARFPISSAYVNPFAVNTFSVGFDLFESIDYPTATTVTYEIKDVLTGTVVSHDAIMSVNLRNRTYLDFTVPTSTLVSGKTYQWRAKIVTDDDTTGFSTWADFVTTDATPTAPTIISPQSKYLDGSAATTLSWHHNVTTGSNQYAYDLQYKQTGDWISLASHTVSSTQSYTVAANFFAAGQMYWRVRTYNIDNVVGTYGTSSANVVQAKPVTPIINGMIGTPRGTVYWQSVGQQAYEIILKDLNGTIIGQTGEVFGTAKLQVAYAFIPDGNYIVYLRIQNAQGVWSDFAAQSVHIANSPPSGDDYLVATPVSGGVKLDISLPVPQGVDYVGESYVGEPYASHQPYNASGTRYVLRDGEPIALITGTTYTDYSSSGEHQYTIRIATSNGNYYDTNSVTAAPIIRYACISKFSTPQNVLMLKFNEGSAPKLDDQLSKVFTEHHYAGRALPVHDISEHYDSVWDYAYSFINKSDYDTLQQMFLDGETVMFRDNKGFKSIGTLGSVKPSVGRSSVTASFTISESDANEVISYV